MDKSITCECGNDKFLYFGSFVKCTNCKNEFKETVETVYVDMTISTTEPGVAVIYDNWNKKETREIWMRRFNFQETKYNENWEKPVINIKEQ